MAEPPPPPFREPPPPPPPPLPGPPSTYPPPPAAPAAQRFYDPANPIPSLGDAIAWPFRDPGWLSKVVVMGLITLLLLVIPIVGWILLPMVILGWTLKSLDNLHLGRLELAPAGFHVGRGFGLFVVVACYYLALAIGAGILSALGGGFSSVNNAGGASLGALLGGLGGLLWTVGGLALSLAYPAIVVRTLRGGIGAGLNPVGVIELIRANLTASLLAGLFVYLTGIIAALGLILCLVGVVFTGAWGAAANAGVVRWYESQIRA